MSSNEVPEILKEKSSRLFFLKAILLGIQYSESGKGHIYKKTLNDEINKLEDRVIPDNDESPNKKINLQEFQQKTESTITQYENILHNLDVQRVNLSSQMANISSNNYSKTLSFQQNQQNIAKITKLRTSILIINKEIEKYTLLLNNLKRLQSNPHISTQEPIMKKNNNQNYVNPYSNQRTNPVVENKRIHQTTNINQNPFEDDNINNNDSDSDKFLKELQKTFGSLSSLLSN